MKKKKAFIVGVSGQDGAYLSKYLYGKKYLVYGYTRSLSKKNLRNLETLKIINKITLRKYLERNSKIILNDILKIKPNEIYFFSGQSSVKKSFKKPLDTYKSNNKILFEILELLRLKKLYNIKFYNSCSTDCFGKNKSIYNNEKNYFSPQSPYARAKFFSFWLTKYFRENYKIHSKSGIISNHESPLRNDHFVIKKIVNFANNHNKDYLKLGNINISRDWGWAPEYVEAIYKINSSKTPQDYVVGTGKIKSLRYIVNKIFKKLKIDKKFLKINSYKSLRSNEIIKVGTNPKKIYRELKWRSKTNINQVIKKMLSNELY